MADEVKSVKDEMNGKSELLPAKWNRFTVADGDWMQSKTLNPLTARDDFLAEQIDKSTSDWQDALSSESATRYSDDQYLSASISSLSGEFYTFSADDYYPTVTALRYDLNNEIDRATQAESTLSGRISLEETTRSAADVRLQNQIDKIKAATDVIAVFGTYDEFVAGSGDLGVTDNDTIKVLRDYNYTPSATDEDYESNDDDGFQVYYEWHDPNAEQQHTDWTGWSAIGSLDPYYSVAEIDDYLDQINNEFDSLSATVANNYLSANNTAVSGGKNITVTNVDTAKIGIKTNDNVSFSSVTALTAQGNSAEFSTFSGEYIIGIDGNANVTSTIAGLINSAISGGAMASAKNVSNITVLNSDYAEIGHIDFQTTADKLIIAQSGGISNWLNITTQQSENNEQTITIAARDLQADINYKLSKSDFSDWSGSTNSVFSGTSRSAQSAYTATSAHNSELLGSAYPSAYMKVSGLGSDIYGHISSYGGSAIAGQGDYVEKSARNCSIGSANYYSDNATDTFTQGAGNSAIDRSLAQGLYNEANYCSLAEGLNNTAINTAFSQGYGNSARNQSITQGYYNRGGERSIAAGERNSAFNYSFAAGSANSAINDSFAQGSANTAYNYSIAQGSNNKAGNNSQAFGRGLVTTASGLAIGQYNKTEDAAFVIGNGNGNNRSDLYVIDHNGNTTITGYYGTQGQSDYVPYKNINSCSSITLSAYYTLIQNPGTTKFTVDGVTTTNGGLDEIYGSWYDIVTASRIAPGSGISITSNSYGTRIIDLSAIQYNWRTTASTPHSGPQVINHESTSCSSLYFNSIYAASTPYSETPNNVKVIYNGSAIGSLIPTPPSYAGTSTRYYLASNPAGGDDNERHWENVSSITADCISGNGTITAIVIADSPQANSKVLYLV